MLGKYIKDIFKTNKTTLAESGIKVFRSTQVTLGTPDKNLEYKEIAAGQLSNIKDATFKKGANPIALKNQTLQAGDVLISARSKLKRVALVRDKDLSRGRPTAAMNGIIIIRSGSEELGLFIQFYLQSPEVQKFFNSDPRTIKNGKRVITIDMILELPFPDIIQKDFSTFREFKEFVNSMRSKISHLSSKINRMSNYQFAKATTLDITNIDSYNLDKWKKIEDALKEAEEFADSVAKELDYREVFDIY